MGVGGLSLVRSFLLEYKWYQSVVCLAGTKATELVHSGALLWVLGKQLVILVVLFEQVQNDSRGFRQHEVGLLGGSLNVNRNLNVYSRRETSMALVSFREGNFFHKFA
jgi:hypothetical protein